MKKRFFKNVKSAAVLCLILCWGCMQGFAYTVGNFSENAFENMPTDCSDDPVPGNANYKQLIREAILASSEEFCYAMSTYYKALALIERVDPNCPPPGLTDGQKFYVPDADALRTLILECREHVGNIIDIYEGQLLFYAQGLTYDYEFYTGLTTFRYADFFRTKSVRINRFFVDENNALFNYLSHGQVYECYEYFLQAAQNLDRTLGDILTNINAPMGSIIDLMWKVSMDMSVSVMEGQCFSMVCLEVLKNI